MEKQALDYLQKDRLSYADMLDCIRLGKAKIRYIGKGALLIEDVTCGICSLAADDIKSGRIAMERLEKTFGGWIVAHGENAREAVYQSIPVKDETKTVQVVYAKDKVTYNHALTFALPTQDELQIIKDNYDRESPENIQRIHDKGELYAAHDKTGQFVGFIGFHPEGSMGLLYIFPEYRRKGYAEETESFLMDECFRLGRTPYGHVVYGNDASMHLQKKLGFEEAPQYIYWLRQ